MANDNKNNNNIIAKNYDPFFGIRTDIDRLFDNFLPASKSYLSPAFENAYNLKLNISENDKQIEVKAELPGVDDEDVDISVNRDVLTIKGEKKIEKEEKDKNYHLVESSYGSFVRSIKLPFTPDESKVDASFKKGILHVVIEKPKSEQSQIKKIKVKKS